MNCIISGVPNIMNALKPSLFMFFIYKFFYSHYLQLAGNANNSNNRPKLTAMSCKDSRDSQMIRFDSATVFTLSLGNQPVNGLLTVASACCDRRKYLVLKKMTRITFTFYVQ